MRAKRTNLLACFLLAVQFATGCVTFPDSNYFNRTREKPKEVDLVGEYVPDKTTMHYLRNKSEYDDNRPTGIILKAGGNLEIVNLPDWSYYGFGESKSLKTIYGKWSVETYGSDGWQIILLYENRMVGLPLLNQNNPYRLFTYAGSPDDGKTLIFIRK